MTQETSSASSDSATQERPHRLILLGLLIIAVSTAAWLGIKWYEAKLELAHLRTEAQADRLECKELKLRLDAQIVINRRQAEMLKAAAEDSSPKQ